MKMVMLCYKLYVNKLSNVSVLLAYYHKIRIIRGFTLSLRMSEVFMKLASFNMHLCILCNDVLTRKNGRAYRL